MTKRMLIDATHAEETRVVVLDGNRLEDFDVETAAKQQLKGNIYLAKVVRVEPSLQAAFVEYGGGRHGFLAFGEIHPDYYQIPVADRQRLMELQEAEARAEEEADDAAAAADEAAERRGGRTHDAAPVGPADQAVQYTAPGHSALPEDPALFDAAVPSIEHATVEDGAPRGLQSESAIPGHAEPGNDLFPVQSADMVQGAVPDQAAEIKASATEVNGTEFPLTAVADMPQPDAAPLGVHNEAAIPGHGEPEHELEAAVDPAYGDQADISAAIEASLAGAILVAEPGVPAIEPFTVPGIEGGVIEAAGPDAVVHHQQIADSETSAYEPGMNEPGMNEPAVDEAQFAPDPAQTGFDDRHEVAAADDGIAPDPAAAEETNDHPQPRAQPAARAQDIIIASGAAYADGADMALEAMEPAVSDQEFAPAAPSEPAGASATHEEEREARAPARFMRSYKIQEVIRRRQILLIQVVKEERGSKGAALTTYISLAGRFSVLMPNSPRGGGISRKITSTADRRRLKEVTSELQIPRGMGLIVRTAGANRPKAEIKRDCEYLLELWDSIRETTMKSMAPALIHEEANLIKRAIRDNYSRDVDEVLVDGEAGWRAARDFMRMLMPAHARKVVLWNNPQPLFAHQAVEAQLDAMLVPTVQLKSGGYLVINQTEALVAVDVNSGRSTRERGIEETALKTNLEAADEVARQLRLRDLAGLIVIDFIDMESRRNNTAVEKRMKDALKDDRARIQLGSISSFGLLEMSRQRLRPSLAETSFAPCPHCGGTGHVRSTETSALAVLRAIEEEGAKRRAAEICVYVAGAIALYVLNHKRVRLAEIEARYGMSVSFGADESLLPPQTRIEKLRAQVPSELPEPTATIIPIRDTRPIDAEDDMVIEEEDEPEDEVAPIASAPAPETAPSAEPAMDAETRKRRRRRRGGRREDGMAEPTQGAMPAGDAVDPGEAEQPDLLLPHPEGEPDGADGGISAAAAEEARGRRRGRRGGRRRRRDEPGAEGAPAEPGEANEAEDEAPSSFDAPVHPAYTGPTPADPFGGGVFDIYDVMEQAEARAAAPHVPEPQQSEGVLPGLGVDAPISAPSPEIAEPEVMSGTMALDEPVVEAAGIEVASIEAPGIEAREALATDAIAPVPDAAEPISEAEISVPDAAPPAEPATVPAVNEPVLMQHVPLEHAAQEVLPLADEQPVSVVEEAAAPEAVQELVPEGRAEPVSAPKSAPVLIGESDATTEKKRGWWRR